MKTLYMIVLLVLAVALTPCLYRVARGPHRMDRLMAFDLIGAVLVAQLAVFSLLQETSAYLDIAMGIAVLSFVSTLAFAAYVTGRRIF